MAYITSYNGSTVLYSSYGLIAQAAAGVHDLTSREITKTYLPGSDIPHVTTLYKARRQLVLSCAVHNATHSTLVSNVASIRSVLMPDDDFHALIVDDRANQQIQALCMGFDIDMGFEGYNCWVFPVTFEAYPYWEDSSAQSVVVDASPHNVPNAGDQVCYPTYTCAVTDTLASGLWFQVGANRFTYNGGLVNTNSLVVDSDPAVCSVKKNGTSDIPNTDLAAIFPGLAVGANSVTCSDISKFNITVAYRQRYK